MSRWIQEFKQHPFTNLWTDLLGAMTSLDVDDKTVATTVEELAIDVFVNHDITTDWLAPNKRR
jgi:hypothetical protein